jgi:hypothetical protein
VFSCSRPEPSFRNKLYIDIGDSIQEGFNVLVISDVLFYLPFHGVWDINHARFTFMALGEVCGLMLKPFPAAAVTFAAIPLHYNQ